MNESNNKRSNGDSKKITITLVLILTLMVTTTGGTYAFFSLNASNNNVVTGTAASANLSLNVSQATLGGTNSGSTKTNVMVPQLEAYLGTAMGSTTNKDYKCVDSNGNTVCKVYTITITNSSSAAVKVDGYITFANTTMPHLKWRKTTNATTLGSNSSAAATTNAGKQSLASSVSLAKNGTTGNSQTYYIVVWIDEINESQTDSGTFTATIEFEGADGRGITSTIRSS